MTKIEQTKRSLIFFVVLLSVISCYAISVAEQSGQYKTKFVFVQMAFLVLGFSVCYICSKYSLIFVRRYIWVIYGLCILLLLGILIPNPFVPYINGAYRWYRFAGFSLQPSEIVKSFFIVILAHIAMKYEKQLWKQKVIMILTSLPILLFIFKQPDLGTTIVYGITVFVMLLFTIKSVKWILSLVAGTIMSGMVFFYVVLYHIEWLEKIGLHKYQFARIYTWLNPEGDPNGAYQVNLSLRAIGSGSMLGNHKQVYIPESHTDMIFSTIANNFGFVGVSILLLIFMLFLQQIVSAAIQMKQTFSMLVLVGFATMYAFNIFENIAMTIGLMPLTGIPLPFISYGGSSVLGNMLALGIMLAVIREDKFTTPIDTSLEKTPTI